MSELSIKEGLEQTAIADDHEQFADIVSGALAGSLLTVDIRDAVLIMKTLNDVALQTTIWSRLLNRLEDSSPCQAVKKLQLLAVHRLEEFDSEARIVYYGFIERVCAGEREPRCVAYTNPEGQQLESSAESLDGNEILPNTQLKLAVQKLDSFVAEYRTDDGEEICRLCYSKVRNLINQLPANLLYDIVDESSDSDWVFYYSALDHETVTLNWILPELVNMGVSVGPELTRFSIVDRDDFLHTGSVDSSSPQKALREIAAHR